MTGHQPPGPKTDQAELLAQIARVHDAVIELGRLARLGYPQPPGPPGEAARPATPPQPPNAAGESPDGAVTPSGAGVSSGPWPRRAQREPDGNGVRPGTGPVFQVGRAQVGRAQVGVNTALNRRGR